MVRQRGKHVGWGRQKRLERAEKLTRQMMRGAFSRVPCQPCGSEPGQGCGRQEWLQKPTSGSRNCPLEKLLTMTWTSIKD